MAGKCETKELNKSSNQRLQAEVASRNPGVTLLPTPLLQHLGFKVYALHLLRYVTESSGICIASRLERSFILESNAGMQTMFQRLRETRI